MQTKMTVAPKTCQCFSTLTTMLTACRSSHLGQEEQIIQVCIVLQGLTAKHDHLAAHCSEALKLAGHRHFAYKTVNGCH